METRCGDGRMPDECCGDEYIYIGVDGKSGKASVLLVLYECDEESDIGYGRCVGRDRDSFLRVAMR